MEEQENQNCEIFEDEDVITLYDEEGNAIKFIEVAGVEYEGKMYGLLSPAEEVEGIGDDEVIICEFVDQDDDTQLIVPLKDEELMQKVFDEYLKTADECDCCDCDECDEDCDCCDCDECDDDCDCDKCDCDDCKKSDD